MYLPEELLVEIFFRVSAASLARLRSVSKGWNALIKDESFAKKRLAKKNSASCLMLIDSRVHLVSVNLQQEAHNNKVKVTNQFTLKDPRSKTSEEVLIRNIFHCDGLLLCTTKDHRLAVWNPFSRETRWIQLRNSYMSYDYFALGKSSCNNKYKILRVQDLSSCYGYHGPVLVKFEIYDLASNSWRVSDETKFLNIDFFKCRVMSVNGSTYWLGNQGNMDLLQSFDYSTEKFTRVSLPGDDLFDYPHVLISLSVTTKEEQKLCLMTRDKKESGITVWVATKINEINGAASWNKFLSVVMDNHHYSDLFCHEMNFLFDLENKVVVCFCKNRNYRSHHLIVLGENKCIQVNHHDVKSEECSLLVNYVPSLIQIQ